jgi:secreted trypsin-like serine protease
MMASIAVLAGCSTEGSDSTGSGSSDVINGVDAPDAKYDAVGALVIELNDHSGEELCTGTLIAPNVVLTAKHCSMADFTKEGSPTHIQDAKVYFVIGSDLQHPKDVAQATAVQPSYIWGGGFTGIGSDVAIYTLSKNITSVAPIPVAATPPGKADENKKYTAIGYGIQDQAGTTGTRKKGTVTVRLTSGAPAPLAFPTPDDYVAFYQKQSTTPLTDAQKAQIKDAWKAPMSDGYEIYVGGATGDSQICHGDSGGPLLEETPTGMVVHGVASTTMDQEANQFCKSGGMYAVFGPDTRDLIATKTNDHCGVEASGYQCGLSATPTTCSAVTPATAGAPTPLENCLATSCCAEVSDCQNDTNCKTLSGCFDTCGAAGTDQTTTQACYQTCYNANAGSYVKYLGWAACQDNSCGAFETPPASTTGGTTTSTSNTSKPSQPHNSTTPTTSSLHLNLH